MAYDLINASKGLFFCLQDEQWKPLLATAQECGWSPAGTRPNLAYYRARADAYDVAPDEVVRISQDEWNGSYIAKDFRIVTASDAKAMARALELGAKRNTNDQLPLERDYLMRFIEFCKAGQFYIA